MRSTSQATDENLTKREANALATRLRKALTYGKAASDVLIDLPPADIAALETFAGIVKERSKQYVNAV